MRTSKPRSNKRAGAARSTRKPRTPASATPPRLLVVDDSKLARTAIRGILENEFEVVEAEDGEQGWAVLSSDDRIRVVITDANMPVLDGYEMLRRIRASEEIWIRHVPVIMVTGVEEKAARQRALELGVTDFFNKPVYKTIFLDKVRTHVHLGLTTRQLIETSTALEEEGAFDPVTGINSRRYFLERVAQDLAYAKRHSQNLSIIVVEIDAYDEQRSANGTDCSDALLNWLATQLKETVRVEDTIARLRESRFAVTMINSGRLEAAVLGDRIRKLITSTPFTFNDRPHAVTASLCLVCAGRDPVETVDDFLEIADRRIARAQEEGGNRMISSDSVESQMDEAITELLSNLDAMVQEIPRQGDKLNPHLEQLLERALVILELADKQLGLNVGDGIRYIKARLHPLRRANGQG